MCERTGADRFGGVRVAPTLRARSNPGPLFLAAMDGGHAENAGAFFGGYLYNSTCMHEHFSAGRYTARHAENEQHFCAILLQIDAPTGRPDAPANSDLPIPRRACPSALRLRGGTVLESR